MTKKKTDKKIISISINDGCFYINGGICNKGNSICEGRMIGLVFNLFVYTDYFDDDRHRKLPSEYIGGEINGFSSLFANLESYKKTGIDMLCFGLQGMNPNKSHYRKGSAEGGDSALSIFSSAFFPDGSLNFPHIETVDRLIKAAGDEGLAVILTVFTQYGERHFQDEFAIMNAAMNIFEWLDSKKYGNLLVNIADQTRYQFKSKLLAGENIFNLIADLKKLYPEILLATVPRNDGNDERKKKNIAYMIENCDFIPVNPSSGANTAAVLEEIYAYKTFPGYNNKKPPVIIMRGDNLNDKYNIYGENNMIQSLKNGASWCYYDVGANNNKDGFICLPVNFDLKSSKDKKKFGENAKKIKRTRTNENF